MTTMSAGILMHHHSDAGLVVLLVHPGGPFWRNRDLESWSIPKGELDDDKDPEAAARREFAEELGIEAWPAPAAWPSPPTWWQVGCGLCVGRHSRCQFRAQQRNRH